MSELGPDNSQRRAFFREIVARAVGPLANYVEKRVPLSNRPPRLRPPGAIDDARLVQTCYRCGACVESCPVDAIRPLDQNEGDAGGTPAIEPDHAPCVVCDSLACTVACPSGALAPVNDRHDIRMGEAMVYAPLCVRTLAQECALCVELCPLGETAIRFIGPGAPEVLLPGCVGCGVCQHHCPTSPKAIIIKPR